MTSYISLPIYAGNIDERLRVIAGQCEACGQLAYPKRPVCIECGGDQFTDMPLSGEATLYTFSVVVRVKVRDIVRNVRHARVLYPSP